MTITYLGRGVFELKSRSARVLTDPLTINDFLIRGPGEYERAGIYLEFIDGLSLLVIEEMNLAILYKREKALGDQEMERLSNVDFLLIPIGSQAFSVREALEVASQIEPKILIPITEEERDLAEFCKEEGTCLEPVETFKISKAGLPQEGRQVIIFKKREE